MLKLRGNLEFFFVKGNCVLSVREKEEDSKVEGVFVRGVKIEAGSGLVVLVWQQLTAT